MPWLRHALEQQVHWLALLFQRGHDFHERQEHLLGEGATKVVKRLDDQRRRGRLEHQRADRRGWNRRWHSGLIARTELLLTRSLGVASKFGESLRPSAVHTRGSLAVYPISDRYARRAYARVARARRAGRAHRPAR